MQWAFAALDGHSIDVVLYGEVKGMVQKLHR